MRTSSGKTRTNEAEGQVYNKPFETEASQPESSFGESREWVGKGECVVESG